MLFYLCGTSPIRAPHILRGVTKTFQSFEAAFHARPIVVSGDIGVAVPFSAQNRASASGSAGCESGPYCIITNAR